MSDHFGNIPEAPDDAVGCEVHLVYEGREVGFILVQLTAPVDLEYVADTAVEVGKVLAILSTNARNSEAALVAEAENLLKGA